MPLSWASEDISWERTQMLNHYLIVNINKCQQRVQILHEDVSACYAEVSTTSQVNMHSVLKH